MEHHSHGAYAHHHPSPYLADGHTHPQAAETAAESTADLETAAEGGTL